MHLVLPVAPDEAYRVLGAVRKWPSLFKKMQIIGNEWDMPLYRCVVLEGEASWAVFNSRVKWADDSLVIDLNRQRPKALPPYPSKAAVVRMGEGSNLDLEPAPTSAGQLLHELARLTGLPFDRTDPVATMPERALETARRQLRPSGKHHFIIHAGHKPRKKPVLAAARFLKQSFSAAVYISGTPSWKHDIPDVHYVRPANLLDLLALARVCDAAVMGDSRLGSLPRKLVPSTLALSQVSSADLSDAAQSARLQRSLQEAMNRKA
ncbi:MAG: hypothetical protein K8R90_06465 [Candidatus Cloacimonetes bacterium]|nr:hypothetical protein [Candidatus Cloacimonadota bacterium]